LEGLLLPLQKKHKATITQRVIVALAKEARVPWKGCAKHVSLRRVVVAIAKEARVP